MSIHGRWTTQETDNKFDSCDPNHTDVEAKTGRLVTIQAEQKWADGTRDTWEVQTLQPLSWLDHYSVDQGDSLDLSTVLDLKEILS